MSALAIKALRDVRAKLGAYIACAAVMAIGVMMYASMTQVVASIPVAQAQFYQDYRFADAFAKVRSMPLSAVERLSSIEGIDRASGRLSALAQIVDDQRADEARLLLLSIDLQDTGRLNDILISEGVMPQAGSRQLCVSEGFYRANGLSPGDTVELSLRGRRVSFEVCASAMSPEFIYISPQGSMLPDDRSYGVAFVPIEALSGALNRRGEADDLSFALSEGYRFEDVERALQDALSPYGRISLIPRADQASHSMLTMEVDSMEAMVGVVPPLFLALGALIMAVIVKRTVEQQHEQIGLMKAYGYTAAEVLGHYAIYGLFIGIMACLMGAGLGALVAGYIARLYRTYFVMPGITGAFSSTSLLALCALSLAFSVGASLFGARGVLRLRAAEAMRPSAPPSGKPILLERIAPLWVALSTTAQMSLRNLFRARSRSAMTLAGLVVCYAMTSSVFAFQPMMDYMLGDNFVAVNRYDLKVSLDAPADALSLGQAIARLEGAQAVEAILETPATLRKGDKSKDSALLVLPEGAELYRLYDADGSPLALPRDGAAITYRMAEELGVAVGERILLDVPGEEIAVTVALLCEQYMTNAVVLSRAALPPSTLRNAANAALVAAENPQALSDRLKGAQSVSSIQNISQVLESSAQMVQTSIATLYAMAAMAVFAGFAIVYNAATVILSERTRELASLRILGFSLAQTVWVVALEELLLCVGGIALGIPLAGYTMQALAAAMAEISDAMAIPAGVPLSAHLTAAASMLGAWAAAVAITARKVRRQPMADVLKGQD